MPALKLSNVKLLESSIATKELNARLKKLSTVLSDMSQVIGENVCAPWAREHAARGAPRRARRHGASATTRRRARMLPLPSRTAREGGDLAARRRESADARSVRAGFAGR